MRHVTASGLTNWLRVAQNERMKRTSFTLLSLTLIVALAASLGMATTQAATPDATKLTIKQGIVRHLLNGTSTNWSGYAVESSLTSPKTNIVNEASGQWVVPTVTCTSRSTSYSASWVGIDGYSDNTVEQTGTEHDCNRGRPQYYAWFEFYPQYAYEINMAVQPGNHMSADIKYVGNNAFSLTITNLTTNRSFTTTSVVPGALRESAEWIAEAPSSWSGVLPLANFGSESFSNASVNMNGTIGSITNPAWQNDPIKMLVSGSAIPKATPGTLSTDGTSFSITWQHS